MSFHKEQTKDVMEKVNIKTEESTNDFAMLKEDIGDVKHMLKQIGLKIGMTLQRQDEIHEDTATGNKALYSAFKEKGTYISVNHKCLMTVFSVFMCFYFKNHFCCKAMISLHTWTQNTMSFLSNVYMILTLFSYF